MNIVFEPWLFSVCEKSNHACVHILYWFLEYLHHFRSSLFYNLGLVQLWNKCIIKKKGFCLCSTRPWVCSEVMWPWLRYIWVYNGRQRCRTKNIGLNVTKLWLRPCIINIYLMLWFLCYSLGKGVLRNGAQVAKSWKLHWRVWLRHIFTEEW